jgi:hypothetical protein
MDADSTWQPKFIDLSQVENAFSFEEGFSRPDWGVISKAIDKQVTESFDVGAAWNEAARQWVMQLRSDLGGDYRVEESARFILLTGLSDKEAGGKILAFAERTRDQIHEWLQDAAWNPKRGKHVILLFSEDDDYYQYVSYFHREGIHPTSGGCLIHRGYVHIAAPYEPFGIRAMLAHELTHNLVVHLPLPLWLNEGLATTIQRAASTNPRPILDHELRGRHLAFWNRENIQEFWAGTSYRKPGDSNHLSYSLAEIMLKLLQERHGNWSAFLKQAHWNDAGQTAALECLDTDLGDVMATFLGEGNWRPQRKAIVALWEAAKKIAPDAAA